MIYLRYLKQLLAHKWFVFLECWKLGIPYLGIIHDLSKFNPDEFIPYARRFEKDVHDVSEKEIDQFLVAWSKHLDRNRHHWQYWVHAPGGTGPIPIPTQYVKEMVADWRGAGRAYAGEDNTPEWYKKNRKKIILHPVTRLTVEILIYGEPISK